MIVGAQLLAAVLLIALERQRALESLADDMQSDARIIVENIAAALLFNDRDAAAETVRSLGVHRGFQRACVYDPLAQLFAAHLVVGTCDSVPGADGAEFHSGVTVNTPVTSRDRGRVGTLALQSSLEPVNARVRNQVIGTLIVLLFSSAAAVLFMARLQRQLTEPLRQLADTAQAVLERP